MEFNRSPFPLTRLPENGIQNVLRNLDNLQLLGLSLLSKRAKNCIKSLNWIGKFVAVEVTNTIVFSLNFPNGDEINCEFYAENVFTEERKNLSEPPTMVLSLIRELTLEQQHIWINWEDMEMNEFKNHIQEIVHYPNPDILFFEDADFNIDRVSKVFKNCKTLGISPNGDQEYIQNLLKLYNHWKLLDLKLDLFPNRKFPSNILIQSLDVLILSSSEELRTLLALDDILIINSKVIEIYFEISNKNLNRFIKLWQKGTNPRVEKFCVTSNQMVMDENVILKDTGFHEANEVFHFQATTFEEHEPVSEGFDIYRKDGTKARITFNTDKTVFEMFICHSHCIVCVE